MQKEIFESLYNVLEEIGLNSQEKELYVLSLSAGPLSIAKLAERMNIARPNVYKIIKGLEKHGLAKYLDNKRYSKLFLVDSPSKIKEILNKKRKKIEFVDQSLSTIIPDVLNIYKQGNLPTKVKVISNKDDMLEAFKNVFEEAKDEIKFFGSSADLNLFVSHSLLANQIKKRIIRGVKIKLLVFQNEETFKFHSEDDKELRETRFLKKMSFFETGFYLFANKIILLQPKTVLAVQIEDEYFVRMFNAVYNVLWEDSK